MNRLIETIMYKTIHEEFFQVPILTILARIQGILAGLMLIRLDLDRRYFEFEQIFLLNGPWDINLTQFLVDRANVFAYDPSRFLWLLTQFPEPESLQAAVVIVILPFSILLLSFLFWELNEGLQSLLAYIPHPTKSNFTFNT